MKKVLLFTVLAILLLTTNLFAETYVSGTIVSETWNSAGSPYYVEGDIFVAGLTIGPGVRIEFLDDYVFEVAGVLTAIGTEYDQILFTPADTNVDGWQGIFFNYSSPGSIVAYCMIDGSVNGGVRVVNSLPSLENCTISNNAAYQGGGVNIDLTSLSLGDELLVKDCVFSGNTSSNHGGGIRADLGSATLRFQACSISGNTSNPSHVNGNFVGGGIYSTAGEGSLVLDNCLISENTSYSKCSSWGCSVTNRGGGIYTNGNIHLTDSIVRGNYSCAIDNAAGGYEHNYSYGGGIYQNAGVLTATNCIIDHNRGNLAGTNPYPHGSGLYTNSGSTDIRNCTIAYNENEGIRRNAGTVNVVNSILYFNASSQAAGTVNITYSDVQDGYVGDGNISFNPILNGCLQILPGSQCIDAGNPDSQHNDVCLPPSLGGVRNDMGAHGGPGACQWAYCKGDFDKDCDIDGSDLAVFAADFGRTDCTGDCEGDFDSDNDVDGSDLAVFAANFGKTDCCPK